MISKDLVPRYLYINHIIILVVHWFYAFMKNGLKCKHINNNSCSKHGRAY